MLLLFVFAKLATISELAKLLPVIFSELFEIRAAAQTSRGSRHFFRVLFGGVDFYIYLCNML